MQSWLVDIINQYGYVGIAFLILLENVFPPIPSELILTFSGFLTTVSDLNIWLTSLFATAGSMLGAILLYLLGRLLPQHKIMLFVRRHGRTFHLQEKDLVRSADWLKRKGSLSVFFCRFIPVVRSLISIPAGAARMQFVRFILFSLVGTALWNTVLIFLGAIAGDNWRVIAEYFQTYALAIGIASAASILVIVVYLFIRNERRKRGGRICNKRRKANLVMEDNKKKDIDS